jgi:hypothetical protein
MCWPAGGQRWSYDGRVCTLQWKEVDYDTVSLDGLIVYCHCIAEFSSLCGAVRCCAVDLTAGCRLGC